MAPRSARGRDVPMICNQPLCGLAEDGHEPTPSATLRQRDELLPVSAPVHVLGRSKQPPADTRQYVEAEAVDRSLTPAARARTDGATASLFIEPDRSNHRGCRRSLLPQHVLEHGCEAIASERPAFLRDGRAHVPIAGARRLLALQRRRIELELGDF